MLHGGMLQVQRDEALQCFKFGVTPVLVATRIAEQLDLPDVQVGG
jgi:ERCC4-related helicase